LCGGSITEHKRQLAAGLPFARFAMACESGAKANTRPRGASGGRPPLEAGRCPLRPARGRPRVRPPLRGTARQGEPPVPHPRRRALFQFTLPLPSPPGTQGLRMLPASLGPQSKAASTPLALQVAAAALYRVYLRIAVCVCARAVVLLRGTGAGVHGTSKRQRVLGCRLPCLVERSRMKQTQTTEAFCGKETVSYGREWTAPSRDDKAQKEPCCWAGEMQFASLARP
jgi:hypothetical protein